QSVRGWVQIEAHVPFDDQAITVFAAAGVTLRLLGARFDATARVDAGAGQSPRQTFRGTITGDWELAVGSFSVVIIAQTALAFDDSGRITFHVTPDKVKLQGVLNFLADLLASCGYSDSGFSFKVLPTGVRAVLNL